VSESVPLDPDRSDGALDDEADEPDDGEDADEEQVEGA
jgi:hypothetical protein